MAAAANNPMAALRPVLLLACCGWSSSERLAATGLGGVSGTEGGAASGAEGGVAGSGFFAAGWRIGAGSYFGSRISSVGGKGRLSAGGGG
jgi:hypothetical protein